MTTTYEKHTPTTDALDTLGSIITENEKRDAIHLAVENVVAGQRLRAGDDVMFDADGTAIAVPGPDTPGAVGIVDPFLTHPVGKGQRFWLVVYPRQIHSLRHVWEHPAFPPSGETNVASAKIKDDNTVKVEAERWLRDYCSREYFDFDALVKAATEGGRVHTRDGEAGYDYFEFDMDYLYVGGTDAHGEVPEELLAKIEQFTGKPTVSRPSYFSCSC